MLILTPYLTCCFTKLSVLKYDQRQNHNLLLNFLFLHTMVTKVLSGYLYFQDLMYTFLAQRKHLNFLRKLSITTHKYYSDPLICFKIFLKIRKILKNKVFLAHDISFQQTLYDILSQNF